MEEIEQYRRPQKVGQGRVGMKGCKRVGGVESGTLDSSTDDHVENLGIFQCTLISSYTIIIRLSPIRGTAGGSVHAKWITLRQGRNALLINVLTAPMRFIILAFTLTSCCPPS